MLLNKNYTKTKKNEFAKYELLLDLRHFWTLGECNIITNNFQIGY